jgi:adenylate kinase
LPLNVLLLGPQGAGKGTQAKRIEAEYGLPHIATGDILRAAMAAGTPLGLIVKPIYDAGELVSDDLMIGLIRERLAEEDASAGFVLDGFPRTSVQASALDAMLKEIDRPLSIILELQIPDDVARERLGRRAALEGRVDDTPEAIEKRLARYHEFARPISDHYFATGRLVAVHGDRTMDEVWKEIQDALEQTIQREQVA